MIMYDEAADFAEHRTQVEHMDAALEACGVKVEWASATVCDLGGGGGMRAALLAGRARRAHCADIIDQHARYNGEFVKLLAEKMVRHGHELPIDRFEFNVTDAMRLMYRDDWFDFVCALNTFEHIPDPARALAEIARVLRPGAIAYVWFDPIWTADTGSHFQHRVADPWAHLVLDEAQFVARMREAAAEDWEIDDFRWAMNRLRLPFYENLFNVKADQLGLELKMYRSWSGVVSESHLEHPNFQLASQSYSREELMTRGMVALLRKRGET
jgi:ubiquinone/menaquinone biosynthesis C-methylase UbiE